MPVRTCHIWAFVKETFNNNGNEKKKELMYDWWRWSMNGILPRYCNLRLVLL